MTRTMALRAAAATIAQRGFPLVELPRIARLPYVNLGHSVLFDYTLFARAVWGTALAMRRLHEQWRSRRNRWKVPAYLLGAAFGAVGFLIGGLFAGAIAAALVAGIVKAVLGTDKKTDKEARALRKQAIEQLMKGELPSDANNSEMSDRRAWMEVGDGRIDAGRMPVLVASEGRPFPGFGRVQAKQLFVCAPEQEKGVQSYDEESLRRAVLEKIVDSATRAGFAHVLMGETVVVHGGSLRKDSPWLAANGCPRLWASSSELAELSASSAGASFRTFLTVQILFPEHNTAATLFIRTFKAGNACAVEIALATLGPMDHSEKLLRRRLLSLEDDEKEDGESKASLAAEETKTRYGAVLRWWRLGSEESKDDLSSAADEAMDKLKPFDPDERNELERESERLTGLVSYWSDWAGLDNWRENHSLTFTTDYFGSAESRAAIRALYERIAAGALDALSDLGMDVSAYRDKEGRWQVHADKIDQLVIGEQVIMKERPTESTTKPAQPKAA
jgi:hypothetical protein